MNPTYKINGDGDTCECQLCGALVRNNQPSQLRHTTWHENRFEVEVKLLQACGFRFDLTGTDS